MKNSTIKNPLGLGCHDYETNLDDIRDAAEDGAATDQSFCAFLKEETGWRTKEDIAAFIKACEENASESIEEE